MSGTIRDAMQRSRRGLVAGLWISLILTLAAAQEEHGGGPTSDRHSTGWDRALRLKGSPLPPKFPKLGAEIERVVLENGMVLYLQEDHRLPLLDAVAFVRAGTFY